jgi:hypothetical protein
VRTIELLGHALVDMRDAPDAQVVLEITVVRAVRPDLDSDLEALTDRVSALERSLTGAAAFPRPAAGPASASGAAPAASEATMPSRAPASVPVSGDAAPEDVGARPSLGAVQRKKAAAAKPVAADAVQSVVDARQTADAPAQRSEVVDRDSLTEAWGDGILRALPARAKALFSAGRFVSVDENGAHFALPNAAHRDRCAEMVPAVEQKLSAHFGTPVTLILDVDDSASPGGGAGAAGGAGPAPVRSSEPPSASVVGRAGDSDEDDPSEFADYAEAADAGEQALEAEARLLQAFPGTSEVSG